MVADKAVEAQSESPAAAQEAVFVEDLGARLLDSGWLPERWQPALQMLEQYPWLGALAVVVAAYVLALGSRLVFGWVLSLRASRHETEAAAPWNTVVLRELRRPVFTTMFVLGLALAVQISAMPVGKPLLLNILFTAVIISWMLAAFRLSTGILGVMADSPRFAMVEARTVPLFDLACNLTVLLVSSYALLLVWGINPVGWLASAGIVGIAVGFAAKDTLANLFSGLFILADSPYKIGDYINLDSGERGKVTAIGMRSTRLLTRADVEITVPNAIIANAKITNESGGRHRKMRVNLPVGVAYGSNVDQVCEVLRRTAVAHAETCGEPPPQVRMRSFGASGLEFELLAWIEDPQDRGRISHEVLMSIYKNFAAEGIEIPYSKQDIYVKELPHQ